MHIAFEFLPEPFGRSVIHIFCAIIVCEQHWTPNVPTHCVLRSNRVLVNLGKLQIKYNHIVRRLVYLFTALTSSTTQEANSIFITTSHCRKAISTLCTFTFEFFCSTCEPYKRGEKKIKTTKHHTFKAWMTECRTFSTLFSCLTFGNQSFRLSDILNFRHLSLSVFLFLFQFINIPNIYVYRLFLVRILYCLRISVWSSNELAQSCNIFISKRSFYF